MKAATAIASLLGIGFFPFASGTLASAVALPFAWFLLAGTGAIGLGTASLAAFAIGIWACDVYVKTSGKDDPSECVVDELAGQWLACAFAPLSLTGFAAAFILFRLFDITKPWPISAAERLDGGLGVMLDDMVAGLFAGLLILAARAMGWL